MLQSFVAAPVIFSVLTESEARTFLRAIFPRFFILIAFISLISVCISLIAKLDHLVIMIGSLSVLAATTSYLLIPALNRYRDIGDARKFSLLHFITVFLTLGILISNSLVIFFL